MTRQTFYRKLRKYADKFTWKVSGSGYIRATYKGIKGSFCPITAVYFAENNIKLMTTDYYVAADKMKLDWMDGGQIAYSADNVRPDDPTYKNIMNVRKTLLRSVGLEKK